MMVRSFFACSLILAACGNSPMMKNDGGDADLGTGDMASNNPDAGPKITMCPKAGMAPLTTGTCSVTAGGTSTLITATILTPGEVLRGGQVLVDATGVIACVGCDCTAQASGATEVECPTGVLTPGLVNAHDHIDYQSAPKTATAERWEARNEWRGGKNGHSKLSSGGSTTAVTAINWAELRGIMAGTTSTICEPTNVKPTGLMRNLDDASLEDGLNQGVVDSSTFPLETVSDYALIASGCTYPKPPNLSTITGEAAYVAHVSEGVSAESHNEFTCLSSSAAGAVNVLSAKTSFVHLIAMQPADYAAMAMANTGLVWSPRSNIRLYGNTATVTTAHVLGVSIALGTDWVPSGSMNMLRELACADGLNTTYFAKHFTDEQLWMMATANAAHAAQMDDVIGIIKQGYVADLAIFDGATRTDHRAVIAAQPDDVVLTMRAGKVLYGDQALVTALRPSATCDVVDACTKPKVACLSDEIGMGYAALKTAVGAPYALAFCGTDPTNEPTCKPSRGATASSATASVYTGDVTSTDTDGDGIEDGMDNCPTVFNPIRPMDNGKQGDADGDNVGDACDPCPLNANTTTCASLNPNDTDGDGILNATDNCPNAANADQKDTDSDGKGDACDACPNDANPGSAACPTTVYKIKNKTIAAGAVVSLNNLLVTAVNATGFYAQVKTGDAGDMGPDFSGIFVAQASPTAVAGNRIDITTGTVTDYFTQLRITAPTVVVKAGTETATPVTEKSAGVLLTAADLVAGGAKAAELEGVLVKLGPLKVLDLAPTPGGGDIAPTFEYGLDAGLRVNDLFYRLTPAPTLNQSFTSITGIHDFHHDFYKLEPRSIADIELGPPVLVSFGPPSFSRATPVASPDAPTIPAPMLVTLSSLALVDTDVTLTSSDPSKLTLPAKVTIKAGSLSEPVPMHGLVATATAIDITATIDAGVTHVTGQVRVLDGTETPVLVSLTPTTATVSSGDMLTMTVTLDIPPTALTAVTLTAGTGTVPATADVAIDTLSKTFTYLQVGAGLSDTVTAKLGSGTALMSTITVGSPLVINEVDYDTLPNPDAAEFVEIYNKSANPVALTGISLIFVNGSNAANSTEYRRVDLTGTIAGHGFYVVGFGGNQSLGAATDAIQNGDPDAIALYDITHSVMIDSLSYGGAVTMAKLTNPTGTFNLYEGSMTTITSIKDTPAGSLARCPDGNDTNETKNDWFVRPAPTKGASNACP